MVADPKLAARHALEEHVGELKLRIEGPTRAELFAEAGRALSEAMGTRAVDGPLVTVGSESMPSMARRCWSTG